MELERLQEIEDYLRRGKYPDDIQKKDKPNFRRRCRNNFKFEGGILYYKKCSGKKAATISGQFPGASEWRVCVRSEEDKRRILESCHGGTAGGHFGRDKTLEKICSRFHWRNMVEEIREYVKKCPQCQRMNANFIKSNAKLHPIPVQPKVWYQVSRYYM